MNGGGYCKAKHGGADQSMSKLEKIMLKFRPIAPKPAPDGSGSGGSSSEPFVKSVRSKRKYVRVNKNKTDDSEKLKEKATSSAPPVVTLPLLPETTPDLLSQIQSTKSCSYNTNNYYHNKMTSAPAPAWLSFNHNQEQVRAPPQVVSYVSVENVIDTWVALQVLGRTDQEIMMNMMNDTCPWFISDGQDKVVWTNKAYRQMTGAGNLVEEDDIAVVLVGKDKWARSPLTSYPAFSCKVKVTFRAAHSHRKTPSPTLTLPCDVWRMERGSCAWRLDVKAALSLGR